MGKLDLNYDAIFEDLSRIMGLNLKRHGRFWHGKCYIDGTPHAYRYDKMVCTRDASGGITIMEQGGDSMQLYKWMQLYGGCSSSKETYERLKSMSDGIVISKPEPEIPTRYVEQSILDEAMERIGRLKDPLFRWLCTKFPEGKVEESYRKLAITPCRVPQGVGTQFWYIDEEQRILHDKIIIYKPDGHRDHNYGGGRIFRTAQGYTQRCYFGEHLGTDGNPYVVESEKTALLIYLNTGRRALATGGSANVRRIKRNYRLLPDYDKAGMDWVRWFPDQAVKWWEGMPDLKEGDDFGDVIYRSL